MTEPRAGEDWTEVPHPMSGVHEAAWRAWQQDHDIANVAEAAGQAALAALRALPVEQRMEAMGMERAPDNVALLCWREKVDRG